MSEASTEHDDDTLREMLRIAAKMEAWATFLDEWYRRQRIVDALQQKSIDVFFVKHTIDCLPDERRTKLIDDLKTAAANLRTLTRGG